MICCCCCCGWCERYTRSIQDQVYKEGDIIKIIETFIIVFEDNYCCLKPGFHKLQLPVERSVTLSQVYINLNLQVEWSVTLVYSLVVERRC